MSHEVGDHRESLPEWKDIPSAAGDRRNGHYLRAIKDLMPDTSDAGPLKRIIETRDRGSLGLWIALIKGFPRAMLPEIRQAVRNFRGCGTLSRRPEEPAMNGSGLSAYGSCSGNAAKMDLPGG